GRPAPGTAGSHPAPVRAGAEIPRDRSGHGAAAAHRAEPCAQSPENVKGGNPMNSTDLQRLLCQGPRPTCLAQTQQQCAALLQETPARPRTGFWAFLSQVWRFTGVPMWAAQGAAAALFFLAAAGQKDLVSWLPLLGPLLV